MQQISYYLDQIGEVVTKLWDAGKGSKVWTFDGAMGAGKTTLIHGLCKQLGVKDAVSSPTFALMNEYRFGEDSGDQSIYHIDLYRIKDAAEAVDAGMLEAMESGAYCFVEWPTRTPDLIPQSRFEIKIDVKDNDIRAVSYGVVDVPLL